MSALTLLSDLEAQGVRLRAIGDRLRIEGPSEVVTDGLARRLKQMKPLLLRALSQQPRAWDASDWREYFEERLAVAMIDGQQPEAEARRIAWECCVARWRDMHPVATDPSRCAHCGREDEPGNIVPFGVGPHVWLHDRCWQAWDRARHEEAIQALRELVGADTHG